MAIAASSLSKKLNDRRKAVKNMAKNAFFKKKEKSLKSSNGLHGMAWWIGRRGNSLIGLCCTNKTKLVALKSKNNAVEVHNYHKTIMLSK